MFGWFRKRGKGADPAAGPVPVQESPASPPITPQGLRAHPATPASGGGQIASPMPAGAPVPQQASGGPQFRSDGQTISSSAGIEPEAGRIHITCGQCGVRMTVPTSCQGHQGVCFGCGAPIHVPTRADTARLRKLDFRPGDRIADRYVLEERIGRGGMGVVYKALDSLIREPVALKFMLPAYLETRRGQRLFIQEAQMARRLRHQNIVATHDVSWTNEGILYLSMEFMQGMSLRKYLNERRPTGERIEVRTAVRIIEQILAALEYAHRLVVHRDLKPENIMLLPGNQVKVLDFGLAKALEEATIDADAEGLQHAKRVVGTRVYAAPEQKQHREIDGRADLYSVGLIFHELLTLRAPTDDPVTVQQVRRDVAPALIAVQQRAVLEDRDQRWQSAAEMRRELITALEESYSKITVKRAITPDGLEVSTEGMARMEGGTFLMGSNEVREESPEFVAEVRPFFIDRAPVTNAQYRAFIEATGAAEPRYMRDPHFNGEDQPVVGVTWHEANAYAAWCGKKLPTEAQWEFAARGPDNRKYPWGNEPPQSTRCNSGDFVGVTTQVRMYEDGQTPDGVLDMAGNVYEWTLDPFAPYDPDLRGQAIETDEPRRAVRGGCWHSGPKDLRTSHRTGLFPDARLNTVGFRCVLPIGRQ